MITTIVLFLTFVAVSFSYFELPKQKFIQYSLQDSFTTLFAHHPEKKIIRKIMDRRPIKHRLSDINRKNVNLHKCITKVENAPSDYTIISAEDFEKVKANAYDFWENGDPNTEWLDITEEDMILSLPVYDANATPVKPLGLRKTGLIKSGTRFLKKN